MPVQQTLPFEEGAFFITFTCHRWYLSWQRFYCSIQLKDNKIYLLAAFRIEKEMHPLDETTIAEATLSIDYPVIVTVGKSHYNIGNNEEFLYRRLAIQSARRRLQKAVTYNRGRKGNRKKLRVLDRFADAEKNYVTNRLHLYSRKLIEICIKQVPAH